MSSLRNIASSLTILSLCFAGSGYASDDAPRDAPITGSGEQSLDKVVSRINEKLQAEYALLEPAPLTVGRFREAVKSKIASLPEDESRNRMLLRSILTEERLPDGIRFHLNPLSQYKNESLHDDVISKKLVYLSYELFIPVPGGKDITSRLIFLSEKFFIVKLKADWSE